VLRRGFGGSGTTAVEPGRQGSSVWESAELSTSYSSEFEAVEHRRRADAGTAGRSDASGRHGLFARKSLTNENPMSGSGPSESARREGDQTVEGARNPEDGRFRAGRPETHDPSADVAEGARNPRRGDPVPKRTGEGERARTLRGRQSLRKSPGGLRTDRTAERREPRGREDDEEVAANQ
jgi:hypothetical protein